MISYRWDTVGDGHSSDYGYTQAACLHKGEGGGKRITPDSILCINVAFWLS